MQPRPNPTLWAAAGRFRRHDQRRQPREGGCCAGKRPASAGAPGIRVSCVWVTGVARKKKKIGRTDTEGGRGGFWRNSQRRRPS